MASERTVEAMQWIAKAITDGFSGEESVKVNEHGEIVIWLNDRDAGYTRLSFVLGSIYTVTPEEFQHEYLDGKPEQSIGEMYIARMRELAKGQSDIDRFYIFLNDDKIYEWDQMGEPPYDMLRALYVEWLGEMTQERRKTLYSGNHETNSANANHMLWEVLDKNGNILPANEQG